MFKIKENTPNPISLVRRVIQRIGRMLRGTGGLILLLIIGFYMTIQTRTVQNWAIEKLTKSLTAQLGTPVAIQHIDIDFFSHLKLDGFYVQDPKGDTLLYSRQLSVGIRPSLGLFWGAGAVVKSISLSDAQINLRQLKGERDNNLGVLLDKLFPPQPKDNKPPGTPFDLEIGYISLEHVHFIENNQVRGTYLNLFIDKGAIELEAMDLLKKNIEVKSIDFTHPVVQYDDFDANPLPPLKKQSEQDATGSTTDTTKYKPLVVTVGQFNLHQGQFVYNNFSNSPSKTTPRGVMDFNHLSVNNIGIDIAKLKMVDDNFTGRVNSISAIENCGFILDKLSAKDAKLNSKRLQLNDFQLITPYSNIGDTLSFKYKEWQDYYSLDEKIIMEGRFHQSKLALRDIMYFSAPAAELPFFVQNKDEIFDLTGRVQGRINKLNAYDLKLKTKGLAFEGSFSSRDFAVGGGEYINLKIDKCQTNMQTLRLFIPGFTPPKLYDKLGNLSFNGRFDGFFADFAVNGDVVSDLGKANIKEMHLNVKNGNDKAEYSGTLTLTNFDLQRWTEDPQFGKISLNIGLEKGFGLTSETAKANLKGGISSFEFKNYVYKNANINGDINKDRFAGAFTIADDNIDFGFDGTINFENEVPIYNFKANINKIDLAALNLIKEDYTLAGNAVLNLTGKNINDLKGIADIQKIKIRHKKEDFKIDSLVLRSKFDETNGTRSITLNSEIATVSLDGTYKVQQIPLALTKYLTSYHPALSKKMKLSTPLVDTLSNQQFSFQIKIENSKNFTKLIDNELDTLKKLSLNGSFNSNLDSLSLDFSIPKFNYGTTKITDILIIHEGEKGMGRLDAAAYSTLLNGTRLKMLLLYGKMNRDTLNFRIDGDNVVENVEKLDLRGKFVIADSFFQIGFLPSHIVAYDSEWTMDNDNFLRFGQDFIETQNFDLCNGKRNFYIENVGKKGLKLKVNNFDLAFLNPILDDKRFKFGGKFNIAANVEDVFTMKNINATIQQDTIVLNNSDWGLLRVDAHLNDLKSPVFTYVTLTKDDQQLTAEGFYTLPNQPFVYKGRFYPANFMNFNIGLSRFPLTVLKYLIGDGVSNMVGYADAQATIYGPPNKPEIEGEIRVRDAGFTIDYLQTRYTVKNGLCKVNSTSFDGTGAIVEDELGNKATITGGIKHDHFDKWGLDCSIHADRALILNTTKQDNPLYYGKGIGKVDVGFTGTFEQTDISIAAVTGRGTILNIPISSDKEASAVRFIKFKDKKNSPSNDATDKEKNKNNADLDGVNVEMAITMTEEAETQLIFDEQAGDIIKGKGQGDIQINYTRTGDFTMFGSYEFAQGEYLFTLKNVVNKAFVLKKGGSIRWNGDPFGAQIDMEAEYKGLTASIYNLISDQLDETRSKDARKPTNIELSMLMQGKLLQPEVTFDIHFPNLTGDLKTIAENVIRSSDQNQLNRQVFGLVMMGNFLPNNLNAADGSNVNASRVVVNTLSGLVSNQFSNYVNELFKEIVTENGLVSSVDIDLNYNQFDALNTSNNGKVGNEFQFKPRINFLNDKLSLDAGVISGFAEQNYFNHDVSLEYILTQDRQLKIRAYNRTEQSLEGGRNRTGVGFVWRKEFDKLK